MVTKASVALRYEALFTNPKGLHSGNDSYAASNTGHRVGFHTLRRLEIRGGTGAVS